MIGEKNLFEEYLAWRKKLVLTLAIFHFAAVLLFDFLAIFYPRLMTATIIPGSSISVGVCFAVGIVISVICASFYYSSRVNAREAGLINNNEKNS